MSALGHWQAQWSVVTPISPFFAQSSQKKHIQCSVIDIIIVHTCSYYNENHPVSRVVKDEKTLFTTYTDYSSWVQLHSNPPHRVTGPGRCCGQGLAPCTAHWHSYVSGNLRCPRRHPRTTVPIFGLVDLIRYYFIVTRN